MEASHNGHHVLSKAELFDKSKFQFKRETVALPEIGGAIVLKTLSVAERDELPELVDDQGNPDVGIPKLAAIFAAVVEEPKCTKDEAERGLREWPAGALDRVIEKFTSLAGDDDKEKSAAAGTFPDKE